MNKLLLSCGLALLGLCAYAQQWNTTVSGQITTTDKVGIGSSSPETKFHVQGSDIGIKSQYSIGAFEGVDAHVDLISNSAGNWGSSLNLIEGNGSSNTDIWSIVRRTSGGNRAFGSTTAPAIIISTQIS